MKRHNSLWSFAIGLAFFAFSLGIFMPVSVSLAGGNSDDTPSLAQICGIGGVRFVAAATTADVTETRVSQGHDHCVYAGLGKVSFVDVSITDIQLPNFVSSASALSLKEAVLSEHLYSIAPIRAPPFG